MTLDAHYLKKELYELVQNDQSIFEKALFKKYYFSTYCP